MKCLAKLFLSVVLVVAGCSGDKRGDECFVEHETVCWPEPGPGSQVRWLDSCGNPGEVVDPCLGTHVECLDSACLCLNLWEGPECTRCPDNWDPDLQCAACRNHWIDEDNQCGTCPGNWDPGEDCAACRNQWIDDDNQCGTCPANWDPTQDCAACRPGWTGDDCRLEALACNELVCNDLPRQLIWQRNPTSTEFDWHWANDYCQNLDLDGHTDWRLPTITELRSLVRGCPAVEPGGACRVTQDCLAQDCHDPACTPAEDCPSREGPGESGCYWPAELSGDCDLSHWSASVRTDDDRRSWDLRFRDAALSWSTRDSQQSVRCVRTPGKY